MFASLFEIRSGPCSSLIFDNVRPWQFLVLRKKMINPKVIFLNSVTPPEFLLVFLLLRKLVGQLFFM